MQRFRELSLTLQLPLVAAGATLVAGLCLLWLALTSAAYLQDEREERYGQSLAAQVAATVHEPLQRGDLLSARASLQRFIDNKLVAGITITDVEGMPMGAAGVSHGELSHRAPIRIGDDIAGNVVVFIDEGTDREDRWRFLFSLLTLTAALSLLVFLGTRLLAQRFATALQSISSRLRLRDGDAAPSASNELLLLEQAVAELPLDMLRGHAAVPAAASDFHRGTIIFVHLASLARYVDTLSETNLHRYTRRLQQILRAAAQCYRGELAVVRPFGVLISFTAQPNAGSEALRAACCAHLIGAIARGLGERTSLSFDLAMALGHCEQSVDGADDMYPQLHLQGNVDDLREQCLHCEDYPAVLATEQVMEDEQLRTACDATIGKDTAMADIRALGAEQAALVDHQARLIIERIVTRSARAAGNAGRPS